MRHQFVPGKEPSRDDIRRATRSRQDPHDAEFEVIQIEKSRHEQGGRHLSELVSSHEVKGRDHEVDGLHPDERNDDAADAVDPKVAPQ